MARLHFHCSNTQGALIDPVGIDLGDFADACAHATRVVQSFITSPSLEDWRSWMLHVCDDLGEEVFLVPFASALGKAN
jgi:hypothetical protein